MHTSSLATEKIVETLRANLHLPELKLVLKEEWSSQNFENRIKIRESLLAEIEQVATVSEEQRLEILDLMRVPSHPQVGVSISHNKKCGGYVINPEGNGMGLDVEIVVRVKESVVARAAASSTETSRAPSAASLWTAKEAAFKCFYDSGRQPEVIAQVEIGDWREGRNAELCGVVAVNGAQSMNAARGCVVDFEDMKVAVFRNH